MVFKMRYSGIGGQAVLEGVMMKNKDTYAVAVRKSDGEIVVEKKEYKSLFGNGAITRWPLVRGVVNFVDSLVLGMSSLSFSSSFFEEEDTKELSEQQAAKKEKQEHVMMGGTIALSIVLAVALFMLLPYWLSTLFSGFGWSDTAIALVEGVLRVLIFLAYIVGISLMKDIQRVYMYHGAEHKCINCIEHGMDLNVENVRKSSRLHKRCGTSFLFFVIMVSVILFIFIRVDSPLLRVLVRILLIPVIDDMIEVGIASVEAVFDWRAYVQEIRE